ncbi:MAG TPA: phosphoribosylformylglycinamidine synthase subunit PurS [Candidatus Limnocylindria bacterium]|nr:phosphoribosylformylglycinamidine synthase subunit PurS [Candidatus Limnocylindria bacterium]
MEFVATIHVRPKPEVRDPQGESVAGALRALGFDVSDVRTGKEIVVRFEASDERVAAEAAHKMGDQLLANPVIEDHAVEIGASRIAPTHTVVRSTVEEKGPLGPDEPVRITWVGHSPRSSAGVAQIGEVRPHIHTEHDEIIQVIDGDAEFLLEERRLRAGPGEIVHVPAGIVHAVRAAAGACTFTTVFAPQFDPDRPDRVFVDR